jgi:hypothetical protein
MSNLPSVPESTRIRDGGHEAENTIDGPVPAVAWRWYSVDKKPDEVVAFFDRELTAQGWSSGGGSSGIPTTDEVDARAWHKVAFVVRLGIFRFPRPLGVNDTDANLTYYEVALIAEKV